jgi:hypothetical protein
VSLLDNIHVLWGHLHKHPDERHHQMRCSFNDVISVDCFSIANHIGACRCTGIKRVQLWTSPATSDTPGIVGIQVCAKYWNVHVSPMYEQNLGLFVYMVGLTAEGRVDVSHGTCVSNL